MKIHFVGICGTFMGSLARLARDLGHTVTGSDAHTYPPMSTQLESLDIALFEGYSASNVAADIDLFIVGNTISRGNPELESILNQGLPFTSGAQFLHDHVLPDRWVLAVAGTHGKTTTASILAWILQKNNLDPGFLIGGVVENFGCSSRLGSTPFFVVEADEYDTAFSDKRSKFLHYQPRTLILNNLEFDHADIFDDLDAIQTQFHHLLKILPSDAKIISNANDNQLEEVIDRGCWSEVSRFGEARFEEQQADWQCHAMNDDYSDFDVIHDKQSYRVSWPLIGRHNMLNATAAIAAAQHVGVPIELAAQALSEFKSVKRRLELLGNVNSICVYDDFAHHPTAIQETLHALRSKVKQQRIIAILEPRSNTMKQGVHKDQLHDALKDADSVKVFAGKDVLWNIDELANDNTKVYRDTQALIDDIAAEAQAGDHIIIMSNGGFENLHQRLITRLNDYTA